MSWQWVAQPATSALPSHSHTWWGGEQWWQCSCQRWNKATQKKCGQCGVKKAYALALGGAPPRTSELQAPTHVGVPSDVGWLASPSPAPSTPPPATSCPSPSAAGSEQDPREAIKGVDAALLALPCTPDLEGVRSELTKQKEQLKKKIIQMRPLGSQLDTCKAAVERAAKRKAECCKALEAAQHATRVAETDLSANTAELAELEVAVASEGASQQPSSLTILTSALSRVMSELKSSPVVPQNITENAEMQMTKLMNDLLLLSQQATSAAAMSSPPTPANLHARCAESENIALPGTAEMEDDLRETPQMPEPDARESELESTRRRITAKGTDVLTPVVLNPTSPDVHITCSQSAIQ